MKKVVLLIIAFSFWHSVDAQMGIGTLNPNPRSVLELKSTPGKGRGLLIPRMATNIRRSMEIGTDSVGVPLSAAHNSLLLFDNTQDLFYSYNPNVPLVDKPGNYDATSTIAEEARVWQILNPWKAQYAFDGTNQRINLIQDTVANGFVGIGWVDYTESPTFPLHVKGDGYFENSNLTVDQTITSRSVKADTVGVDKQTQLLGFGSVPVGFVGMWSGTWDNVVEAELRLQGWMLCDGREIDLPGSPRLGEDTPDMRGRFVVGFDSDASFGDPDYANVGDIGPNYGTTSSVADSNFYLLVDGGKQVKLKEPAMPQHNHNANNLMHNHEINLPLVKEDRVTGTTLNRCPVRIQHTQNADGIHSRVTKTIGQNYSLSCPSTGRYRDWTQIGYENNGFLTFNSENTALSLDTQGGLVWPLTSPKFGNPDETAMPIENRPPYYVLAYIIRVK